LDQHTAESKPSTEFQKRPDAGLTVLVEDGEDDGDDVVVEVDVGHRFGDVLQRGCVQSDRSEPSARKKKVFFITGVDRGAGDVVERQRRVHVVDVAQQVEEVQVVLQADAGALFGVPAPKYNFF